MLHLTSTMRLVDTSTLTDKAAWRLNGGHILRMENPEVIIAIRKILRQTCLPDAKILDQVFAITGHGMVRYIPCKNTERKLYNLIGALRRVGKISPGIIGLRVRGRLLIFHTDPPPFFSRIWGGGGRVKYSSHN